MRKREYGEAWWAEWSPNFQLQTEFVGVGGLKMQSREQIQAVDSDQEAGVNQE